MMEQLVATGSCVLRKVGGDRAGEMACHRFLSSPHASVEAIVHSLAVRTAGAAAGRHVVCVQDTSEVNFKGRDARRRGLGAGADGETPAFFMHPLLAVDAEDEAVLGLAGARVWTRPQAGKARPRRGRGADEKESRRWLEGAQTAGAVLGDAASVTVVGDRESDLYTLFANKPEGVDLLVRVRHDRKLAPLAGGGAERAAERAADEDADGGTDEGCGRLFGALAGEPVQARTKALVPPRGPGDKRGDRSRDAEVELRARRVRILRPASVKAADAPAEAVVMTFVEAREPEPPEGRTRVHWRLLCSADIAPERAVALYRLRWRVEQLFRATKSDGLGLDGTQVLDAERLMRLAAMALGAAARIMQLTDARDGSQRPLSDALDTRFAKALAAVSKALEGRTERQKNPHPPDSLAFLSWTCARLGGWNCYYKPPGPKTMRDGWNTLAAHLKGYALAAA
jgi:hypothetical protein